MLTQIIHDSVVYIQEGENKWWVWEQSFSLDPGISQDAKEYGSYVEAEARAWTLVKETAPNHGIMRVGEDKSVALIAEWVEPKENKPEYTNIIFLDVDGVLNSAESIGKRGVHLDAVKVALVRKICQKTNARVVISSSWRYLYSLKTLQAMLWAVGLSRDLVVDCIPHEIKGSRGSSIKAWLQKHYTQSYVIIDDSNDMLPEQQERFVHTSFDTGMTRADMNKAIEILRKGQDDE